MAGKKGRKHFSPKLRAEIEAMRKDGKIYREIAEHLGMQKEQIRQYFKRKYRNERLTQIPKTKGRPRKKLITKERELEIKVLQLQREIELYQAFTIINAFKQITD